MNMNLTIRNRTILSLMITSMVAVLVAGLAFIAFSVISHRRLAARDLELLGHMIEERCVSALRNDQPKHIQKYFSLFNKKRSIRSAVLRDDENNIFALYTRGDIPPGEHCDYIPGEQQADHVFSPGFLHAVQPLIHSNRHIGTLVLCDDMSTVRSNISRDIKMMAVLMVAAMLLAYLLALKVHALVSSPLKELARTARTISREDDYSVRAEKTVSGELGQLVDTFNDMLEHLEAARDERTRLISELEARNRELEKFTYTVSHDLKSPLVGVKSLVGQLRKHESQGEKEKAQIDMAHIDESLRKMTELIQDLLDLSRVGRVAGEPEETTMDKVIKEALRFTDIGRAKVEVQEDMPKVIIDRPRVEEVYQNLVDNAVKFTSGREDPNIKIGFRTDGEKTVFFVSDNGEGVDPAYKEKIFGLFEKLDPAREGTGVGLSIVRRIVEYHNGKVWAESRGKGKGSTFCFTLGVPVEGSVRWQQS